MAIISPNVVRKKYQGIRRTVKYIAIYRKELTYVRIKNELQRLYSIEMAIEPFFLL